MSAATTGGVELVGGGLEGGNPPRETRGSPVPTGITTFQAASHKRYVV